jgi:hypothetical protein
MRVMESKSWLSLLNVNPLETLLGFQDEALTYFVRRDLLNEPAGPIQTLWGLPEVQTMAAKQYSDGSWIYPGKKGVRESGFNYNLLETYRSLRVLVEMYGCRRGYPVLDKAAEYVFDQQTDQGDIRGILGNQYMPYYHGAILELLIKAGYQQDERSLKGLEWLLSVRQEDGGWIVPAQLIPAKQKNEAFWLGKPFPGDRSKPHAHLATGMAVRAFAAHPEYRHRPEARAAGKCLKTRLLQADKYSDRRASHYWLKYQFPFWWTSLLTALDTLYRLGFDREDEDVSKGLAWFQSNQAKDGLWETGYGRGRKAPRSRCWVGLAVCRVLKLYYP